MLALVIDTSSAAVIAGLVEFDDGRALTVRAEQLVVDGKAHGERLSPLIKATLAQAGATMSDLTAVVAGVGPGPFTGLRVGLISAAAIADALGVATYAVCSLDGIAGAVDDPPHLLVAGDARRREVYWARYANGVRVEGPAVDSPADVRTRLDGLSDEDRSIAMAGAGARQYADVLGLPLLDQDFPSVAALAAVARDRVRDGAPSEVLVPLYLRRPDAKEPAARPPMVFR